MEEKERLREIIIKLSKAVKDRKIRTIIDEIVFGNFEGFIALSETLSKIKEGSREEDLKLAHEFFKVSIEDLKTCRILNDQNIYNLAVYHLQQSIEKLTKAYGLAFGYISKKDLRRCGHATPRIFIQLLQDNFMRQLAIFFEKFKIDTEKVDEVQKLFFKKKSLTALEKEIALFDKRKIMTWINTGKNIRKKLRKKQREIDMTLERFEKITENMIQLTQDERKEIISICRSIRSRFSVDFISNLIMLYILSVITFPHFSSTRYPDGEIKPLHYKSGLGIIDCLEAIVGEVEYCIEFYDSFLISNSSAVSE